MNSKFVLGLAVVSVGALSMLGVVDTLAGGC